VDPQFWQDPASLQYIYAPGPNGEQVPLSAFAAFSRSTTPISVNHQSQFPSTTISFNLDRGTSLGEAVTRIEEAERQIGMPAAVQGKFSGTAQAFQESLASESWLIAAALLAV